MWIVVLDRPFYPHVEVYPTEELALQAAQKLRREKHADEGAHEVKLYVASVTHSIQLKTHY